MKQIIILILFLISTIIFSQKCSEKTKKKEEINKCKIKIWKDSTKNEKPKVFKRKKKRRVRKKYKRTKHINKRKK